MSKAILIFGSFNPPTMAHVNMSVVLHRLYPDFKIIYIPANEKYIRSWKGQYKILPMKVRCTLLANSIDRSYSSVSLVEGTEELDGKTYNTVIYYKSIHNYIVICLGKDNLIDLDKWYRSEGLVSENKFIIVERSGIEIPDKYKGVKNFTYVDFDSEGISSTKVREAYRNGELKSVKNIIPSNVYCFLKCNEGVF